ncbi:hypothetical protein [Sphingomonas sp. UYP23]
MTLKALAPSIRTWSRPVDRISGTGSPTRRTGSRATPAAEPPCPSFVTPLKSMEEYMGKGCILWLIGVPIPVILLLWLLFGH